jgi:hypothetical protein
MTFRKGTFLSRLLSFCFCDRLAHDTAHLPVGRTAGHTSNRSSSSCSIGPNTHKVSVCHSSRCSPLSKPRITQSIFIATSSPASLRTYSIFPIDLIAAHRKRIALGTPVSVATRAEASMPDVSTIDAFKQTLLVARSIVYADPAKGGASGDYFSRVLDRLGIAEQMKSKAILVPGA